jgi:hypothetical protein
MARNTSYDNGDAASDAGEAHTAASLKGHKHGWRPPVNRPVGGAVTVAQEPIDFGIKGATTGVRVITAQHAGLSILDAAKTARGSLRDGLTAAEKGSATIFLKKLVALNREERPKLLLVQISGANGSSVTQIACCIDEAPSFRDGVDRLKAPGGFILIVSKDPK